jgi:hypothetical protein
MERDYDLFEHFADGVGDCARFLKPRCDARGVQHDRKTTMSKLQKR